MLLLLSHAFVLLFRIFFHFLLWSMGEGNLDAFFNKSPIGKAGLSVLSVECKGVMSGGVKQADQIKLHPRVDPETAASTAMGLWELLHQDRQGFLCLLSGFRIGANLHGTTERYFAWPHEGVFARSWTAKQAAYGRDVYQVPYLLARPKLTARLRSRVVAADLDQASLEGLPVPALVVETSPARNQVYWILDELVSPRVADYLSRAVQLAAGLRPRIPDYLRIPGIPNFKYHDVTVAMTRVTENSYQPGNFAVMLGLDPKNLSAHGPGVVDSVETSSLISPRVLRRVLTGASALALTFGSLGLRGTGISTPSAAIASEGPSHVELDRSPEEFRISTVNLGRPDVDYIRQDATALTIDPSSDLIVPENDGPPPSVISETAGEEFDLVREVGQTVFQIQDDLT